MSTPLSELRSPSLRQTGPERNVTACVRLHAFTFASTGERLIQQEGNLVVYNASGTAIWHTSTGGHPGAFLTLQDDGNLVVYDASGKALWWLGAYATVPTDCSAVKSPVVSSRPSSSRGAASTGASRTRSAG